MKSGFKDPIAIKGSQKELKSPWNFDAPQYDERSSYFVNAGSHYGVGHKQPVGHKGNPKARADTMPMDGVKTMRDDEVPHKNLRLDIQE
jgi:hypothetical protein